MDAKREAAFAILGAVPVKARHYCEQFFRQDGGLIQELEHLSRKPRARNGLPSIRDIDLSVVPVAFRSCLRGALYSSFCYFEYMNLHDRFELDHDFECSSAALDMAHTFAEVVPIELYNAREISTGVEFLVVTGMKAENCRNIFDDAFPRAKDARDAVTHYHDRVFSRWINRKLDADPLGRPLSTNGKIFTDQSGQDFDFQFEEGRFARYFLALRHALSSCA